MPSEIVENIAYLSNYLEESHARVRELEKELANVKDGCVLREALQVKCIQLEAELENSAGMAAKALRERLEAETTLEETRKKANETRDGQETSTELRAAHDALAAGAERYVLLKTKYNKVKENKTALRGALTEQDAQIHSLGEKISRIQAEYEAEKKEKAQLQQALRELLETAEGLRNEGKESIDQKKKRRRGIRGEVTSDISALFL
ncbi:hypothetical protein B0H14DRAFT_3524629 [Mycena olivaceomarginata]|nr:hypothetical protein B0H14DRAFT_3524629 [Mycena olivaceomarginata]